MSDTPRVDKLTYIGSYGHLKMIDADFARELERENAGLREEIESFKSGAQLNGNEHVYTFGGESWIDDIEFAEYGIDFGDCAIHGMLPAQAILLATTLVDHLMLNGHRFEIVKTGEQDQRERLVCVDKRD